MKKNYLRFLALLFVAFTVKANAQCSSCTSTITGVDATNYVVASGQTLCIAASGNATGLITVSAGGTVCNSGTISSPYFWVSGGTLNNYGTINVSNLLVSNQGVFNNNASATSTHDSILITNIYSALNNFGTINTTRMGNSDASFITNNGSIVTDYLGDSAAQFNNNPSGILSINVDFYNAYNSGFFNSGYVEIDRDFFNSTGATFETDCMMSVGRDWYNTAIVYGPALSSCGGFNIVGASYNTGTLGNSTTRIDICDAGSPPLGLDGPGGTIASTTTYCTCANACAIMVIGIDEVSAHSSVLIQNIYPNPSSSQITIELKSQQAEELIIEVMDMVGKKISSVKVNSIMGLTNAIVDVSKLAQGTYILSITDSKKLQSKKLFSVAK